MIFGERVDKILDIFHLWPTPCFFGHLTFATLSAHAILDFPLKAPQLSGHITYRPPPHCHDSYPNGKEPFSHSKTETERGVDCA